ncbi:aminoacyl-tRNA hydrolase [Hippea jasoniae]|uniref:aminoacyl-tRNA hydrolase n=1 Tax=Hippea jasoniae TaxID=944479 RepID=UPI000554729C|nr:aminoacyl-tRNA hydrolase [Hippea jasoniae]
MDWLVVGLGNPGREYEHTPHNAGFMVCDHLARIFHFEFNLNRKFAALVGEFFLNSDRVKVLKPLTYMNLSGNSVAAFFNFYKFELSHLIVAHDDIDLDLGVVRIKKNSSSGGHKGVQSIIDALGSRDFIRVKVGVGRYGNAADYVLNKLNGELLDVLQKSCEVAAEAIKSIITEGLSKSMTIFNKRVKEA